MFLVLSIETLANLKKVSATQIKKKLPATGRFDFSCKIIET